MRCPLLRDVCIWKWKTWVKDFLEAIITASKVKIETMKNLIKSTNKTNAYRMLYSDMLYSDMLKKKKKVKKKIYWI